MEVSTFLNRFKSLQKDDYKNGFRFPATDIDFIKK